MTTPDTVVLSWPSSEPGVLERAQRGDLAALEALFRTFERRIYGLALRILAKPEDAEEVLQEGDDVDGVLTQQPADPAGVAAADQCGEVRLEAVAVSGGDRVPCTVRGGHVAAELAGHPRRTAPRLGGNGHVPQARPDQPKLRQPCLEAARGGVARVASGPSPASSAGEIPCSSPTRSARQFA